MRLSNPLLTLRGALRATLLPALLTIGACQASNPGEQPMMTLSGVLVLKGNVPHTTPVLQTDDGNWELIGVDTERAHRLQRHRIVVTGRALPSQPPQRPRLQVETLEAAAP